MSTAGNDSVKRLIKYPEERAVEDAAFGRGLIPTRLCRMLLPVWRADVQATIFDSEPYDLIDRFLEAAIAKGGLRTGPCTIGPLLAFRTLCAGRRDRLLAMEGQARAAVSAWTARSLATASRLSRVPRREGNSGSSGCPPRSLVHALRIFAASGVSGVQRSLRLLPWQRRWGPSPRWVSAMVRPVSSLTRSPVWTAASRSTPSAAPRPRPRPTSGAHAIAAPAVRRPRLPRRTASRRPARQVDRHAAAGAVGFGTQPGHGRGRPRPVRGEHGRRPGPGSVGRLIRPWICPDAQLAAGSERFAGSRSLTRSGPAPKPCERAVACGCRRDRWSRRGRRALLSALRARRRYLRSLTARVVRRCACRHPHQVPRFRRRPAPGRG